MKLIALGIPQHERKRVEAALKKAGLCMRRENPKSWYGHPVSEWLALDEQRMKMPGQT